MSTEERNAISRRTFLKVFGASGLSLVIGIYLSGCDEPPPETSTPVGASSTPIPSSTPDPTATARPSEAATPAEEGPALPEADADTVLAPNIYLKIDPQGQVTITAFRSEMGQGIRTAIAMILADELDVPWEAVKAIEQAPADPAYGDQVTGGSLSVTRHYAALRRAGAVVRHMLVTAAAEFWEVDLADCTTEQGFVVHPAGQERIPYGDLVAAASRLDVPRATDVPLKDSEQFRIIGTRIGHWDAPAIVTGRAEFGLDVRLPGMLYAAIARCPVFGGEPAAFDPAPALQVPGVRQVRRIENWVAVVADHSWAAFQGRAALDITWDEGSAANLSSADIQAALGENFPDPAQSEEGVLSAIYDIPYLAHVTMEPMNCTAHVHDGFCEVWAPTQNPQAVHQAVRNALRLPSDAVKVQVTFLGGGFGRRLRTDYALEAALVSQAIRAPVQVVWSRADDIQHDFYHPMSRHYASVRLDNFQQPTIRSQSASRVVPTGDWRSVFNFPEAYVNECFTDEIAHAIGRDPYDLRMQLYSVQARQVIQLAAERAGWGSSLPAGWGRGLAYFALFGVTHVAQVVELEVTQAGNIRVHRVVCAVDCGTVVNPDGVEAQMQGAIAFGLTAALKSHITIAGGRVQESNFHDHPILSIDEMPVVEVHLVESDRNPTGVGEAGVPPVAPAVANAVFAATGVRVRHIPILPGDLSADIRPS